MKIEKPQPQESIGKYPVIREIGSGATSHVYLARDTFAERDVAIKVLDFTRGVDAESERLQHKAFLAEASLAGKLNHPHIVDIYDAVVEPNRSYLVMEYLPGSTLESTRAGPAAAIGRWSRSFSVHPRRSSTRTARHHPPDIKPATSCCRPMARPRSRISAPRSSSASRHDHADQGHRLAAYMSP